MNAKVKAIEEIADKHIFRINQALDNLKDTFPISAQLIPNLSIEQIFSLEMLTSRFAKLQDHLGANVIDLFFELNDENADQLTMIDKLNKLEKLRIIEDAHLWREMRKARNIIEHEYPDKPDLIANTLNLIHDYCPKLMSIKQKLFAQMHK